MSLHIHTFRNPNYNYPTLPPQHHQEMLEKNTEKLHEYTEKTIDQVDRTHVVNLTRITEKFMTSLLASMYERNTCACDLLLCVAFQNNA